MYATIEKLYPAFVSKHNSNREKEVILSMISNGDEWHYLAVKKYQQYYEEYCLISAVIFIVWVAFIPLGQKTNLNRIKKYIKIQIFVI